MPNKLALGPLPSLLERPLSIAMLAPCPFPTHQGTQVVIRHLATTLARAGHEVHLVTYANGEYEAEFPFHLHRSARVTGGGLRSGPTFMKPAADAALLLTAARVVKAYNCVLLHVHNVEGLGVGALLKLQTQLPVVYHAHNAMGPELPTYFRANLAQAFASVVGDVIDRTLPRAADAVITFDQDHKALHEIYGVASSRLHVIPPGIDGEEILGAPPAVVERLRGELGPGPWILYAGNPDGYQNLPLLWKAFARVREKRPDAKLLVATGHDPSVFDNELKDAPSRDGIRVYRHRDLDELRAMFAIADLGVCPRALWTGAPIKVLNYLAAGLPVVCCRASGRHILSQESGIVVDDDEEAFATGVLTMLDQKPPPREKQRLAFAKFRIEDHVGRYEMVYRDVLAKVPA